MNTSDTVIRSVLDRFHDQTAVSTTARSGSGLVRYDGRLYWTVLRYSFRRVPPDYDGRPAGDSLLVVFFPKPRLSDSRHLAAAVAEIDTTGHGNVCACLWSRNTSLAIINLIIVQEHIMSEHCQSSSLHRIVCYLTTDTGCCGVNQINHTCNHPRITCSQHGQTVANGSVVLWVCTIHEL